MCTGKISLGTAITAEKREESSGKWNERKRYIWSTFAIKTQRNGKKIMKIAMSRENK